MKQPQRQHGVLNGEPERYRPDDAVDPKARSEQLLADRRAAHDGDHGLRAYCKHCGKEFGGTRPQLLEAMTAHMEAHHGVRLLQSDGEEAP